MKRHFLLILALFVFASIRAQVEIIKDVQSDTRRTITTSSAPLMELKKNGSFTVFMQYVQTFGTSPSQQWLLGFATPGPPLPLKSASQKTPSPSQQWLLGFDITTLTTDEMTAGMKVLIKCDDGAIIEGRLVSDIPESAFMSKPILGTVFYHIYPRYILAESDLDHIAAHKIVKIRMEAPWNKWGHFDMPSEDVKLWTPSETITALFVALKTRLRSVPDNSIYHDF